MDIFLSTLRGKSSAYFRKTVNATKLGEVTFPNSMKARKDALSTSSVKFSSKLWTEAEKKFNEAVTELEDGDLNNAKEKANEAEKLNRQAELEAIKVNYLDETRLLLKKAGCHTVYVGMESVNPKSLKSMKKQQTVEEMAQAMQVFRQQQIHVHGMFVYGFDDDDWHTVKETVRFAKRAKFSSTQFMILTPLPGSEFYDRVRRENRIQFHDWALYDARHAVFKPKQLSLFELQQAQIFVVLCRLPG